VKQRVQIGILAALLLVWAWVYFRQRPVEPAAAGPVRKGASEIASSIPDAALNLDRLQAPGENPASSLKRNIFEYGGRAREVPPTAMETAPPPPPPPRPPAPPVKFYGFALEGRSGVRRVFLSDGEEIYVAAEGDTLGRRYRLVKIGAENIEVEDITGGRRWVVPLEQ
jgi:hypothetical protein